MFRSMLVTSGCALELTLAVQEAAVLGVQIALLSGALAVWGTLAHVRHISRQVVGVDLPATPAGDVLGNVSTTSVP
jgi:hypothetical protein